MRERGGGLAADEAGADDDARCAPARPGRAARARRRPAAERAAPGSRRARRPAAARLGAGGEHARVVRERLAAVERDACARPGRASSARRRGGRRCRAPRTIGRLERQRVVLGLAAQELLRERGAQVRRVGSAVSSVTAPSPPASR